MVMLVYLISLIKYFSFIKFMINKQKNIKKIVKFKIFKDTSYSNYLFLK